MRKELRKTLPDDVRRKNSARRYKTLLVIGWREWISLPNLHISAIKAKIDTGARTSALHAYDIREYTEGNKRMVSFKVHPNQRDTKKEVRTHAPLVDKRYVRDSGGKRTLRPVIETEIKVGDMRWKIELTLINRDEMGFRMLLGREAIKGHLLVNPGKSFVWGHP
jgi:hypothetical protein